MEWAKAIGIFLGVLVVLVPTVKWLISDWAKKKQQIEILKAREFAAIYKGLEKDLDGLGSKMRHLESVISKYREEVIKSDFKILQSQKNILRDSEKIAKDLDARIKIQFTNELGVLKDFIRYNIGKKNG